MGNVFYNKIVTVYNKTPGGDPLMGKEVWYPTVLKDVRLLITRGANTTNSGLESADTAKLFIKRDSLLQPYLKPKEWQNTKDKEGYFTLSDEGDFFVEGDTSQENSASVSFAYMKKKYDNCFAITNVDTYDLIPHFEVGGK